jgi:hypothetical protein
MRWPCPVRSIPPFGNNADINIAVPLFPSPNYALGDCGLFLDPAGTAPVYVPKQ